MKKNIDVKKIPLLDGGSHVSNLIEIARVGDSVSVCRPEGVRIEVDGEEMPPYVGEHIYRFNVEGKKTMHVKATREVGSEEEASFSLVDEELDAALDDLLYWKKGKKFRKGYDAGFRDGWDQGYEAGADDKPSWSELEAYKAECERLRSEYWLMRNRLDKERFAAEEERDESRKQNDTLERANKHLEKMIDDHVTGKSYISSAPLPPVQVTYTWNGGFWKKREEEE